MLITVLKWLLIVLLFSDFAGDFALKFQKEMNGAGVCGAMFGLAIRLYALYILITLWVMK